MNHEEVGLLIFEKYDYNYLIQEGGAPMEEITIGKVVGYFGKIGVGAIKITAGQFKNRCQDQI